MPSPIGHTIISLGTYFFIKDRIGKILSEWKMLIFVLIAGNLPDIDYIPGIYAGDISRFHATYTHTLGFAILAALMVWAGALAVRYKYSFRLALVSFILVYMHVFTDCFNMDSRPPIGTMLFWPFTDKSFYICTPLFYPLDRHNLGNLFSVNNLIGLITELSVSIPFLILGVLFYRSKRKGRIVIGILLLCILLFSFSKLTVDKWAKAGKEAGIKYGLRGKVVFNSNISGINQIYVIDIAEKKQAQLTEGNRENLFPAWSFDGNHIVFVSTRDGNKEIYVMDKKGKSQKRLTSNLADDTEPAWMPDNKRILFVSDRDGVNNFYTIDITGKNLTKITQFGAGRYAHPVISGRGDVIVYGSNEALGWQIYSFNIGSKEIKRLTGPPTGNCDPDISRDGTKILYSSRFGVGNSDIWMMDADGENKDRLTSHPALDYNPRFSPDNKFIIFNSERDGNWNLYIMEIETKNIIKLTDTDGYDDRPSWGH